MLFLVFIFALIINLFTSSHRSNSTPSSNTLSNNTISSSCIADPDELRALLALASDGETFLLAISYSAISYLAISYLTIFLSAIFFTIFLLDKTRWDFDHLQRRLRWLENWGWCYWRQNWGRDSWKSNIPWPLLVWPEGQQKYPCWYCTARRGEYHTSSGEQNELAMNSQIHGNGNIFEHAVINHHSHGRWA